MRLLEMEVTKCRDCPLSAYSGKRYCSNDKFKEWREIPNADKIPAWCPLAEGKINEK